MDLGRFFRHKFTVDSEKKFVWFNLPAKVRNKIIKDMDFETRMSFFVCSELSLLSMPDNCTISCRLDQSFTIHLKSRQMLCWHTDLFFDFCTIFQKFVQKNASSLVTILVYDNFPSFENATIKELKNLKILTINFQQHKFIYSRFTNFEQLTQVKYINIQHIKLSFEKLIQFKSESMQFSSVVGVTSADVNMYLKHFASGQIQGKINKLVIDLDKYDRNFLAPNEVVAGLEIYGETIESQYVSFALASLESPSRIAVIHLTDVYFSMQVFSKQNFERNAQLVAKYGDIVGENLLESFEVLEIDEVDPLIQ